MNGSHLQSSTVRPLVHRCLQQLIYKMPREDFLKDVRCYCAIRHHDASPLLLRNVQDKRPELCTR